MIRPPRLAELFLTVLLPRSAREEILGDLAEAHRLRASTRPLAATAWYWAQVFLVPVWLFTAALTSVRVDPKEVTRTLRGLLRTPGFTAVAVLSLGMGIGATTAISGALHALLFTTLPLERPDELNLVYHTWPEHWERSQMGSSSAQDPTDGATVASNISWPAYETLRQQEIPNVEFSAFSFVREMSVVVGDSPAQTAGGMLVSGDFFTTLRMGMHAGRPLSASDDQTGAKPVVVISYPYWQRGFGGDPSIVGRSVRLNGLAFEVVGITKKGYVGLSPGGFFGPSDVMIPMIAGPVFLEPRMREGETLRTAAQLHWVRVIARVARGTEVAAAARAWSAVLGDHMVAAGVIEAGDVDDMQVRFLEGRRGLDSLRSDTRGPLTLLSVVVALVLLIACANLTTLLLARGAARAEELAVRRALGASRWELARPQIVESLLLGIAGGLLGLLIAVKGGPLIVSSLTGGSGAAAARYEVNGFLVGSAIAGALVAGVLSGLIPAVRMMRTDPGKQLGVRSQGSARRFGLGRALIATQIAISVPLVVGAGLFLRTLGNLVTIDPGFDAENMVVFRLDASFVTKDSDQKEQLYLRILDDLRLTPGVRSASIVENVLVSGWQSNTSVEVDGERRMMDMNGVSPTFFETMGIEHLSGRALSEADDADAPAVVLVNATAEQQMFDGNALGKTIQITGGQNVEVVGVVADTKYSGLKDEIQPAFYDPWRQRRGGLHSVHYVVRSDGTSPLEPTIRQLVADAAPGLPVAALRSQSDHLNAQAGRERIFARLLTGFGAFALLLACVGLHGLMSFGMSQRRSEMGVRLALGATPSSIITLVLRQVVQLTGIGLLAGLVIAFQVGPLVRSQLFGIEPHDGPTMAIAAAVMVFVSIVAGWMPAYRASRVDPLRSLAG